MRTLLSDLLERSASPSILVRFPNWIGDAVMALPALERIRRSLECGVITVLAKPAVADVVSLSGTADQVEVYAQPGRHSGLGGKLRLVRQLRGRYDGAVLFQNAFEAALLSWGARIPLRGGYDTDGRRILLTHPVPCADLKGGGRHQAHYYLDLASALGFEAEVPPVPSLTVDPLPDQPLPYAVFAPGASYGPAKMWPAERYAELGRRLSGRGYRIVLLGSASEGPVCASVAAGIGREAQDLSGRTSIREAAGILSGASLAVSNDSGLMHLAAAVGAPLVALFGSTDHVATGPLSDRAKVLAGTAPCAPCFERRCPTNLECFDDLTVDRVEEACLELVGEGAAH